MSRKKAGRSGKHKAQNQTSSRRNINKRKDSSTSTSTTDFYNEYSNDLFIGADKSNLNEEDENFLRNLILANKAVNNLQQIRPKGLTNLGNTCYLNSVCQVLSQTPFFYESLNMKADPSVEWTAIHRDYFKNLIAGKSDVNLDDFKLSCKLSAPSILNSCLVSLLRNLKSELKSSSSVITPSNFVREISSTFAQFKNYNQQDSHELIRCLLDTIRTNEINRQRKAILESLNLDQKKIKLLKEDDEKLAEVKAYSDSSNFTVVDSLFGGYCISSLKCEDCESTSQIFEQFFDLSLPISEESDNYHSKLGKRQQPKFIHNQKDRKHNAMKQRNRNVNREESEEKVDNVPDNVPDDLVNENVKNLSTKDRKLRRQLKKAAKRQVRQKKTKSDDKENEESNNKEDNSNELNLNPSPSPSSLKQQQQKSSTLEDESDDDSEASSDDEASSNELSELKNDLSEEYSNKLDSKDDVVSSNNKKVQSMNSVDSGINSSNLNSEVDMSVSKLRKVKTISPVHEEITDDNCEQQQLDNGNQTKSCDGACHISDTNNRESDTGFEDKDKNVEADSESEESNSLNADDNEDSDQEAISSATNNQITQSIDNEVFNDPNQEEKKGIRSSSQMENNEVFKRKIKWTLSTVSKRNEASFSCSILSGLARFTKIELLVGSNKIFCENCTNKFKNKNGVAKKIYTNASRQTLIALPSPILTLHLKRFEVNNRSLTLSKINKFCQFPLVFDLSPFVSNVYKVISDISYHQDGGDIKRTGRNTKSIIYNLYGLIEHSGSLRSGHYRCYVRVNSKEPKNLNKFVRLQPYVPKIADLMDLITLDDIEKDEEDQQLNEMLANMNLQTDQTNQSNGDLEAEPGATDCTNEEAKQRIREELIKATKERWFHISDSSVQAVQLKSVLKAQAYLLFYERVVY